MRIMNFNWPGSRGPQYFWWDQEYSSGKTSEIWGPTAWSPTCKNQTNTQSYHLWTHNTWNSSKVRQTIKWVWGPYSNGLWLLEIFYQQQATFDLALLFDPCYWNFRVLGCQTYLCTTISLKIFRVRTPNFQGSFVVEKINYVWNFISKYSKMNVKYRKRWKFTLLPLAHSLYNILISNFTDYRLKYLQWSPENFISIHCWNQEKKFINLVLARTVQPFRKVLTVW